MDFYYSGYNNQYHGEECHSHYNSSYDSVLNSHLTPYYSNSVDQYSVVEFNQAPKYPDYGSNYSPPRRLYTDYYSPSHQYHNGYDDYSYAHQSYNACNYFPTYQPTIAYSVSNFSEPKSIEFNDSNSTQFVVSYSNVEFNEPAFEEYDPTPYGGGYDIAATYGKPLPPSEETCHPHSNKSAVNLPPTGPAPVAPVVTPIEKTEQDEPSSKPQNENLEEKSNQEVPVPVPMPVPMPVPVLPDQTKTIEEPPRTKPAIDQPTDDDSKPADSEKSVEIHPSYGEGYNHPNPYSFYGHTRMMPPPPPGCGMDALDICDGFLGYWPCLYKNNNRRENQNAAQQVAYEDCYRENEWQRTLDCLFGSSYNPYVGRSHGYGGYENS